MTRKIILPDQDGVQNLEIRRFQAEIERETNDPGGFHRKTLDQVSVHLDDVRRTCEKGHVRGLVIVALLTDDDPRKALGVFCSPDDDDCTAMETWQYAAGWMNGIRPLMPGASPDDSA